MTDSPDVSEARDRAIACVQAAHGSASDLQAAFDALPDWLSDRYRLTLRDVLEDLNMIDEAMHFDRPDPGDQ